MKDQQRVKQNDINQNLWLGMCRKTRRREGVNKKNGKIRKCKRHQNLDQDE